jgi:Peptidase M15
MLGDPRIGQNQLAPDLSGDPDAAATFDERWVSENPWQRQNEFDPNQVGRPVGRNDVPPAPHRTGPSETPFPKPRPAFLQHPPEIVAALEGLDPAAAQMWTDNAAALRAKGIEIGISSGRRGATHNARIQGAKASQHLLGKATDIKLEGLSPEQRQAVVSQFLSDPRVNGFGFYPEKDAIHVDVRTDERYAWGTDYTRQTIGEGWPKWMTDQVREWLRTSPPRPRGNDAPPTPLPRARP